MILNFYHVIKNDIFTDMTIRLDMKSPKCPYKINNNNKNTLNPTFLSPLSPPSSSDNSPPRGGGGAATISLTAGGGLLEKEEGRRE